MDKQQAAEAQTEAITGILEDAFDNATHKTLGGYGPDRTDCQEMIAESVPKILALFNPSGEAPQAKETICSCGSGENNGHDWNCPWQEQEDETTAVPPAVGPADKDNPPAQSNAGPVWVNASENKFPLKDGNYFMRQPYPGGGFRGWWQFVAVHAIDKNYWVTEGFQWLDESTAPAQQLFTREQVDAAHTAGVIAGNKQAAGKEFQTQEEYMTTNFPPLK